jgi:hypothetical protein
VCRWLAVTAYATSEHELGCRQANIMLGRPTSYPYAGLVVSGLLLMAFQ